MIEVGPDALSVGMRPYSYQTVKAAGETFRMLEQEWLRGVERPPETDYHGYLPLALPQFCAGLQHLGDPHGKSFLEVGCGIGTKLLYAHFLGFEDIHGIELWAPYLKVARRMAGMATLHEIDAFEFDAYGHFDVVYSYRCCRWVEDQERLDAYIVSLMRPGALAFLVGQTSIPGATALGDSVWRVDG